MRGLLLFLLQGPARHCRRQRLTKRPRPPQRAWQHCRLLQGEPAQAHHLPCRLSRHLATYLLLLEREGMDHILPFGVPRVCPCSPKLPYALLPSPGLLSAVPSFPPLLPCLLIADVGGEMKELGGGKDVFYCQGKVEKEFKF